MLHTTTIMISIIDADTDESMTIVIVIFFAHERKLYPMSVHLN